MTKTESVIRAILGPTRWDIRPFACSIDMAAELMFTRQVPMDDILITKDVYLPVARQLHKTPGAVARRVERLANLCWDTMVERALVRQYIGASIKDIRAPGDIVFYLAFYVQFDRPFFTAVENGLPQFF